MEIFTDRERAQILDYFKKVMSDDKLRRAFWISRGMITKSGRFTKRGKLLAPYLRIK